MNGQNVVENIKLCNASGAVLDDELVLDIGGEVLVRANTDTEDWRHIELYFATRWAYADKIILYAWIPDDFSLEFSKTDGSKENIRGPALVHAVCISPDTEEPVPHPVVEVYEYSLSQALDMANAVKNSNDWSDVSCQNEIRAMVINWHNSVG